MNDPIRASGDIHLSERNADLGFRALDFLYADARAEKGYTILLGDIFDQGVTVNMPLWNRVRLLFRDWPGTLCLIPGNHDQFHNGEDSCLTGLAGGNCFVMSRPICGTAGVFVPYVKPELFGKALEEALKLPPASMLPILWTHQGFKGAYRNSMVQDRDGVSCADIPDELLVVSGHYHMPHNIGRIIYCGSPWQQSFAEEGQEKGWLKWENPSRSTVPKRLSFGGLGTRYFTVRWNPKDGPPAKPEGFREGDRVRIITETTRDEALKHRGQLEEAGLGGVAMVVQAVPPPRRGVVTPGMDPRRAAYYFILANQDKWSPDQMDRYATEAGLWG